MKRTIQLLLDVEVETEHWTQKQCEQLAKDQFTPRDICCGVVSGKGGYSVSLKRVRVHREKED